MTTTYSSLHAVVDKTMKGIDAEGSFDPTEGDNPALARNNLGEVWNQQVSREHHALDSWISLSIGCSPRL